jgi:hypothetical protein
MATFKSLVGKISPTRGHSRRVKSSLGGIKFVRVKGHFTRHKPKKPK